MCSESACCSISYALYASQIAQLVVNWPLECGQRYRRSNTSDYADTITYPCSRRDSCGHPRVSYLVRRITKAWVCLNIKGVNGTSVIGQSIFARRTIVADL